MPPSQRLTVCVNQEVSPDKDVSVRLESDMPFIAEKPMYFDYKATISVGSNVIGSGSCANGHSFAYVSAETGFEQWLCILNPSDEAPDITATYYLVDP
ncbi:MAG: hypothetical protein SWK76_01185 [Actinomycetota bacterium]|nr:hypothetical protein [Actinomycetota bacterium]